MTRPDSVVMRKLCDLFYDAAILPAVGKAIFSWEKYQTRHGIFGNWNGATGIAILPNRGARLALIEYDDPALKPILLDVLPALKSAASHRRGEHGSFAVRFPTPEKYLSLRDANNDERLSIRTGGTHCQIIMGDHYQKQSGEWVASGDKYIFSGSPIPDLTASERDTLYRLIDSLRPPEKVAAKQPVINYTTPVTEDFSRYYAIGALRNVRVDLSNPRNGFNNELNRTAWKLGGFIALGLLSRDDVEAALLDAAYALGYVERAGLKQTEWTIASGLKDGIGDVRSLDRAIDRMDKARQKREESR